MKSLPKEPHRKLLSIASNMPVIEEGFRKRDRK